MIENQYQKNEEFVKLQFYDAAIGYENLWALALGGDRYRIESIPFFIYDVALGDIVEATSEKNGYLCFKTMIEQSKNRTLRARSNDLMSDTSLRSKITSDLEDLGCKVEIHRDRLLAINVPLMIDLEKVTNHLTDMRLSWEYGSPSRLNS